MGRFLSILIFLFIPTLACAPMTAPAAKAAIRAPATEPLDLTVALVTDTDKAYCAGTWVRPDEILTASHCVIDDDTDKASDSVHVRDYDGVVFEGKVIKLERRADLALLHSTHMHATWAAVATTWHQGEELTIIGHPNREEWTWMRGWVSKALRHDSPEDSGDMSMLQVEAPIWYGNSGGGAFDASGALVGVCSMRASNVPDLGLFVAPDEISAFLL